MVSSSIRDNRMALLAGLGFSGSIQDRESALNSLTSANKDKPLWLYGNSLSLTAMASFSSGNHYSSQVAKALGLADPVSYGVGGRRIADVCYTLINGSAGGINGLTGILAAGKWPGASQKPGLVLIDSLFNDVAHTPNLTVVGTLAAIPTANQNYLEGLRSMYRTALAVISSDSRIEQDAGGVVRTGTWAAQALAAFSNGGAHYTTTVGDNILYPTVRPPQKGPLAGKVFHLSYRFDAVLGTQPTQTISVDGGAGSNYTATPWEQYVGHTGANFQMIPDVATITLPVDGNNHSVRLTHAGAAGNLWYADCLLIPSETPPSIGVMERMLAPVAGGGTYDAANTAIWKGNRAAVNEAARSVVEEFPNAIWVREGRTQNGLYSADGVHSNDRGVSQDAAAILQSLNIGLIAEQLRTKANSNFAIL